MEKNENYRGEMREEVIIFGINENYRGEMQKEVIIYGIICKINGFKNIKWEPPYK